MTIEPSKRHLHDLVKTSKIAQMAVAQLTAARKNKILSDWAQAILRNQPKILRINQKDVRLAARRGHSSSFLDRLTLTDARLQAMVAGLKQVKKLPNPVGEIVETYHHGELCIRRVRIPLGLVAMIYEARPNVTVDAAALCFKAGNACVLRGGSEAFYTNRFLVKILQSVLRRHKCAAAAVTMLPTSGRQSVAHLLSFDDLIDVAIPRGGTNLMSFVKKFARVPVIRHDKGVCSLFVDASANLEKSLAVVLNAKTQRPGVCNALETLYVHKKIARSFLQKLVPALAQVPCEVRGDAFVKRQFPKIIRANEADWGAEYLDQILAIKVVKNVREAMAYVQRYSSHHTDGILTETPAHARLYRQTLDSACLMINTSTRFHDGFELGLGAEIGISTTKIGAYGAMGLRELTTLRFEVDSDYKTRKA